MGIGSFFSALGRADFEGAFGSVFVSDAEMERGRMLDDQLTRLTGEREAQGYISAEQALQTYGRISQTTPEALLHDPMSSPLAGFVEGAREGADNIRKTAGGAINEIFGLAARLIPWQVWLVLGVLIVIWLWPMLGPIVGSRIAKKA